MSSSSSGQLERAAKAASQAVRDAATDESPRRRPSALAMLRKRAIQMAVVVAAIAGLSWAFGSLISVQTGAFLFVALVLGSVASSRVGEFSFPFALSALAIGGLIAEFVLPASITAAFDPLVAFLASVSGIDASMMDPVTFAVLAAGTILTVWVVEIRITSAFTRASGQPEAANADTVARRLAARIERLFEDYVNIGTAFVALLIAMAGMVLMGAGEVGGQLGEVIGQAPVLFAGFVNWAAGFLALGGEVPVIGDWPVVGDVLGIIAGFDAGTFALFGAVALLAAVAVKNRRDS